ncbi:hypothetical protein [Dongia rigui]|uniref:Yip1 domain-containing protein n=1 Tax=Dongia rigui TaxID=940149 RepID=A0ABU5DWL5_9PROT|nr:hypothetical protein [Dongia rigui]MDY0871706.1 hypothetical protein [Dongia rigui]
MPSWIEAQAAITGLKRLLRFDAGFVNWFDGRPSGARRAFWLMLPMLPMSLFNLFVPLDAKLDDGWLAVIAHVLVWYVLSWVMFPLILIVIGQAIRRESQTIGAITPFIWYNFFLGLLSCTLTLLSLVPQIGSLIDDLTWPIIIISLIYEVFLLQVVIGVGYVGAGLIAIVDFALSRSLLFLLIMPVVVLPTS